MQASIRLFVAVSKMHLLKPSCADFFWSHLNLRWVYTDLFSTIYRQTRNVHIAHDVLHDAIVKFAVKNSLKQIDEPHAYLRTVVKNTLVDYYRDANHFVALSEDDAQSLHANLSSEQCSPENMTDIKQRMQALQTIIDYLPPKCRQVFWMHRIEGLAQKEVALALGISLNMVEKHMIRALVDITLAKRALMGG